MIDVITYSNSSMRIIKKKASEYFKTIGNVECLSDTIIFDGISVSFKNRTVTLSDAIKEEKSQTTIKHIIEELFKGQEICLRYDNNLEYYQSYGERGNLTISYAS